MAASELPSYLPGIGSELTSEPIPISDALDQTDSLSQTCSARFGDMTL